MDAEMLSAGRLLLSAMIFKLHGSIEPPTSLGNSGGLYRLMAREYEKLCKASPARKVGNALHVGARAFGMTLDQVRDTSRDPVMIERRYRIIAFAVVATGAPQVQIERAFNRKHPAIKAACDKYADEIRAALGR